MNSGLAQLSEIRKASLAKMLCDNSQFARQIQPNVFLLPNELTNALIHCRDIAETDLHKWQDTGKRGF